MSQNGKLIALFLFFYIHFKFYNFPINRILIRLSLLHLFFVLLSPFLPMES
jgi:hypothetical protein